MARGLFEASIEHVEGLTDAQKVAFPNTSEATFCQDRLGRRWVRKRVANTGSQPLLAEAVGWLLAKELGVPVPEGAVGGEGDDLSWLSGYIERPMHWDPARAHFVHNVSELGARLALDALL